MNKLGIGIVVFTILVLIGGAFFLTKPAKPVEIPTHPSDTYEYFWGNGCPHCAKVAEFMDSWDKKDSIKIEKREVWYNKDNATIMADRGKSCGIDQNQMAVPFLVTPEGKCIMGDDPIIELFKSI